MVRLLAGAAALMLVIGCGSKDGGEATGGAATGAATAKADDGLKAKLDAISNSVAKAETSDDFLKIVTDCGGLQIQAAMDGKKIEEDANFREVCTVAPAKARAQKAIKESDPAADKMSSHCLSAGMGLEDLIEKNIQKEEMQKLLADVNKACGT